MKTPGEINIGCFGAIRPLKNHLTQALAAIEFAKQMNVNLKFHINSSRLETGGDPILKNLEFLFADTYGTMLVKHPWHEPEHFLFVLKSQIDIGMQVSLSETFNVVTADYITAGVPVVVSDEIKFVTRLSIADKNSVPNIVKVMKRAYNCKSLAKLNRLLLSRYSARAQKMWFDWQRDAEIR